MHLFWERRLEILLSEGRLILQETQLWKKIVTSSTYFYKIRILWTTRSELLMNASLSLVLDPKLTRCLLKTWLSILLSTRSTKKKSLKSWTKRLFREFLPTKSKTTKKSLTLKFSTTSILKMDQIWNYSRIVSMKACACNHLIICRQACARLKMSSVGNLMSARVTSSLSQWRA